MGRITTIGLDADDTLWHNERFFKMTEERFRHLLGDYADPDHLAERLLAVEKRNLAQYGFGIKGFTLSMIETALEVTNGRAPGHIVREILHAGREMLSHPVETFPHVHDALETLARDHTLILITKGDLFDQERKLAASGLGDFFDAVEIVSDKTEAVYARIFAEIGDGPGRAVMAGNSLKSDVLPAIGAGAWGVHIPHELEWGYEAADPPTDEPRFRRLDHIGELPATVAALG